MTTHREAILDQFTRQAVPFATAPGIQDETALRLVVEFSGAGPDDTVLDVACGPGIVVCAFARVVKHATGLDLTPAMLDRARALQGEKGLGNITWQLGEAMPLEELKDLYRQAGLPEPRTTGYRLEGELEGLIERSFPNPGDDETLRRIFRASVDGDTLGIGARRDGETIRYGYPVAVLVADKR